MIDNEPVINMFPAGMRVKYENGKTGTVTRTSREWPLFFVFVRHDGEEAEHEYFMTTSQNPRTLRLIPEAT